MAPKAAATIDPLDIANQLNAAWQQIIGQLKGRVDGTKCARFLAKNAGLPREIALLIAERTLNTSFLRIDGRNWNNLFKLAAEVTHMTNVDGHVTLEGEEIIAAARNHWAHAERRAFGHNVLPDAHVEFLRVEHAEDRPSVLKYLDDTGYRWLDFGEVLRLAYTLMSMEGRVHRRPLMIPFHSPERGRVMIEFTRSGGNTGWVLRILEQVTYQNTQTDMRYAVLAD